MTPQEIVINEAKRIGLDPRLALSVWQQESGRSVDTKLRGETLSNNRGNAVGPWQVVPYYHPEFPVDGDFQSQTRYALGYLKDVGPRKYYGEGVAPPGHPTTDEYERSVLGRIGKGMMDFFIPSAEAGSGGYEFTEEDIERIRSLPSVSLDQLQPDVNQTYTGDTSSLEEFTIPAEGGILKQAKNTLATGMTFDEERERSVLEKEYPKLRFYDDGQGNVIVDATAYGGNVGFLNKPGISASDLRKLGINVGLFAAGSGVGGMALGALRLAPAIGSRLMQFLASRGLLAKSAGVGVGEGAIQAGIDLGQQALGGTDDVSAGNISKGDVLFAAGGGMAGRSLEPVVGRIIPALKDKLPVTESTINGFRNRLREQGVDDSQIPDNQLAEWMRTYSDSPTSDPKAIMETNRFGIDYTYGESLPEGPMKNAVMAREDMMLNSGANPGAQAMMQKFKETQKQQAINSARAQADELAGGAEIIPDTAGVGEIILSGVRRESNRRSKKIDKAYKKVPDNVTVTPEGTREVLRSVNRAIFSERLDVSPDTKVRMIRDDAVRRIGIINRKIEQGRANDTPFMEIEHFRRWLSRQVGDAKQGNDRRGVMRIISAVDDEMTKLVDNGLKNGDEETIKELRKARAVYSAWKRSFDERDIRAPRGGKPQYDTAGKKIQRMLSGEDGADASQVTNWFFGVNQFAGSTDARKLAVRMRQIFGRDSDEWGALRQAGFLKIFQQTKDGHINPQAAKTMVDRAKKGTGYGFLKELYSPEELQQIDDFIAAIERSAPQKKNPSGTAYVLTEQAARSGLHAAASAVAHSLGLPMPGVSDIAIGAGVRGGKHWFEKLRASRAISGAKFRRVTVSELRDIGAAGGVQAGNEYFGNRPAISP